MSISEQVKHLKELSDTAKANVYSFEALSQSLREAADTIESLSTKLQAANMERSADDCGGWIYCGNGKNLPTKNGFYFVTIIDGEIFGTRYYKFKDGHWYNYENMDKYVIAWQFPPEPYHEP